MSHKGLTTINESTIHEDDFLDEDDDETALLEKMNNPYSEFEPRNFTIDQKVKWLNKEDEEFIAKFEQNQSRFKLDLDS